MALFAFLLCAPSSSVVDTNTAHVFTSRLFTDHGEINSLNSTRRMIGEMSSEQPPSFVMHIGDIAYSVGYVAVL